MRFIKYWFNDFTLVVYCFGNFCTREYGIALYVYISAIFLWVYGLVIVWDRKMGILKMLNRILFNIGLSLLAYGFEILCGRE